MQAFFSKKIILTFVFSSETVRFVMHNLLIKLRHAQLWTHAAHNNIAGPSFFSDHAFLGDTYGAFEEAYDGLIEMMIAEGKEDVDALDVTHDAAANAADFSATGTSKAIFERLLELEQEIAGEINEVIDDQSNAIQNYLQGLATDSLMRQYKIQKRLTND